MPHYRGRYRRRPMNARQIYKRRFKRRSYKRRRTNKVRQAISSSNRYTRKLKRMPNLAIQRTFQNEFTVRKFSVISFETVTLATLYANKGTIQLDYLLGHCIPNQDITFYKSRYMHATMQTFTITFFIQQVRNFTRYKDTGADLGGNIMQQVTDTRDAIKFYVGSFNSPDHQAEYYVAFDNATTTGLTILDRHLGGSVMRRLTQTGHQTYQWHLPKGYQSTYTATSPWIGTNSLDATLTGPPNNEPHGMIFWVPEYNIYGSPGAAYNVDITVSVGFRIDSTWTFAHRRADI